MPKQSETALKLCQNIGASTMFDESFNNGMTLPLHVSKNLAKIVVTEIIASAPTKPIECELYADSVHESTEWWLGVIDEIEKL